MPQNSLLVSNFLSQYLTKKENYCNTNNLNDSSDSDSSSSSKEIKINNESLSSLFSSDDFIKKIILAGKYANDLAVRFNNSEISLDKVVVKTDLDEMILEIKEKSIGEIYVITCFSDRTKFMDRRYMLW